MQCNVKVGKMIKNPVNQRKLHIVHTLRFGTSTKVAHGRTRVNIGAMLGFSSFLEKPNSHDRD